MGILIELFYCTVLDLSRYELALAVLPNFAEFSTEVIERVLPAIAVVSLAGSRMWDEGVGGEEKFFLDAFFGKQQQQQQQQPE